jgi:hypothetical protein
VPKKIIPSVRYNHKKLRQNIFWQILKSNNGLHFTEVEFIQKN